MLLSAREISTKEKYYVTVEIQEFYNMKKAQYEILVEKRKTPSLGDYITMFKNELGIDVKIEDITKDYLEFKPLTPIERGIQFMRITRSINNGAYTSITTDKFRR